MATVAPGRRSLDPARSHLRINWTVETLPSR